MKTPKTSNLVPYGLLLGLAGSLFLNLYQLNEYNRRLSELPSISVERAERIELGQCRQENARKDSLLSIFQNPDTFATDHSLSSTNQ